MKIKARVVKINDESKPTLKGYASITIENCCQLNCIKIGEKDGELYATFPSVPVMENNEQKLEDGKPMYETVFYPFVPQKDEKGEYVRDEEGRLVTDTDATKEARERILNLVIEAYNNENGRAYINQEKGEFVNAKIEPLLYPCNGEKHKAAGSLLAGGYILVNNVFVDLAYNKDKDPFLAVQYPFYKSGEDYKNFAEPLSNGKVWDRKEKVEKDYNFKAVVEGVMKKQTREFHPELAAELDKDKSVDELLSGAKAAAENADTGKEKVQDAPELAQ